MKKLNKLSKISKVVLKKRENSNSFEKDFVFNFKPWFGWDIKNLVVAAQSVHYRDLSFSSCDEDIFSNSWLFFSASIDFFTF